MRRWRKPGSSLSQAERAQVRCCTSPCLLCQVRISNDGKIQNDKWNKVRMSCMQDSEPGNVCRHLSRSWCLLRVEVLIKIDWTDKIAVAQVDTRGNRHHRQLVLICGGGTVSKGACLSVPRVSSECTGTQARDTRQQSRQCSALTGLLVAPASRSYTGNDSEKTE